MKSIVGLLAFILFSLTLSAQDYRAYIEKANKDYADGLYNNAIEGYQKVLQYGYESAELYYNLGNACFKVNDLASAILYYEKAKKIKPNDEDINFNLNIANSRITDKIEQVPMLFYKRWWFNLYNLFSVNSWAKLNVVAFVLLIVAVVVFIIARKVILRKVSFWLAMAFLFVALLSLGFSVQKYHAFKSTNEAIVFDPSVTIKSSPSDNSVDLFVVHEGAKVKVTDAVGEWYEIRIANGSVGWIKTTAVKKI
jgi:tetratricopeptide (TPR) repeat protein